MEICLRFGNGTGGPSGRLFSWPQGRWLDDYFAPEAAWPIGTSPALRADLVVALRSARVVCEPLGASLPNEPASPIGVPCLAFRAALVSALRCARVLFVPVGLLAVGASPAGALTAALASAFT